MNADQNWDFLHQSRDFLRFTDTFTMGKQKHWVKKQQKDKLPKMKNSLKTEKI